MQHGAARSESFSTRDSQNLIWLFIRFVDASWRCSGTRVTSPRLNRGRLMEIVVSNGFKDLGCRGLRCCRQQPKQLEKTGSNTCLTALVGAKHILILDGW